MNVEEALLYQLQNSADLSALVGKRIYFIHLPVDVQYPAITIQKISAPREQAFISSPGIVAGRFQFTSFDDSYPGVKSVIEALNTTSTLKDFVGLMGSSNGVQVDCTIYENETELSIDPELGLYGIAADWIIYYHE